MIQMVAKHDIQRKIMRSGVNIKLAKGLMIDIGMPHKIRSGSDIKEITNCNSKKDTM